MDDWFDWPTASGSEPDLTGAGLEPNAAGGTDMTADTFCDPSVGPHESLWILSGETVWDLGPGQLDADGDGVRESMTSAVGADPVILSDTDGDGRVDRMARMCPLGVVEVTDPTDTSAAWSPTSLGRLT